jgi:two-component system nitrogen regulation response regulator GlnG
VSRLFFAISWQDKVTMNKPTEKNHEHGNRDDATWTAPLAQAESAGQGVHLLTLVWHPAPSLIGCQALVPADGQTMRVNRFEPLFADGTSEATSLGHASISRASLELTVRPDGTVQISRGDPRLKVEVNGYPLDQPQMHSPADVALGIMLILGGRVALCLHRSTLLPTPPVGHLLGPSDAMERLRRQLHLVASTEQPVLVLGETGTGKELVAQAVHRLSPRRDGPWVAVNMAALSDSMATAELFGSARGAYTGSVAARAGLWAEAEGGTLFLDEIGDTPDSVQPMLLRAIESGEFRPLGANRPVRSNVRLVAATDRALHEGQFNQPLLRRLESFVVRTPALRERRQDLGVLIRQALAGAAAAGSANADWLAEVPPPLIRALCLYHWPGNVRQLRHVVRRLALGGPARLWPTVEELFGAETPPRLPHSTAAKPDNEGRLDESSTPAASVAPTPPRVHRSTTGITEQALLEALDRHSWCLQEAAHALGVSRPSIYNLIERYPHIRKADEIERDDVLPLLSRPGATLSDLAIQLRTPREALRRRLRTLGLQATATVPLVDDTGGASTP